MALSLQDLLHGLDLTVVNPISGVAITNVTDQAAPFQDTAYTGKGLILRTKDTALNIADVPDASVVNYEKWKSYIWVRLPHASATDKTPLHYFWNDDAASDVTYLKWIRLTPDVAALMADIAAVEVIANNSATTAAAASANAAAASTLATNALTEATDASTLATNANITANAAKTEADTAITTANAASTNVTNMQSDVSTLKNTSVPNLQTLEASIAILAETANAGTNLGNIAGGQNTRGINYEVSDLQDIVQLTGGKIKFNKSGTFYIRASIPYAPNLTGVNDQYVQSYIKKDSDNSVLAAGQSTSFAFTGTAGINCQPTLMTEVEGVIAVTKDDIIRVDMHASSINGSLGIASQSHGSGWPAAQKEVYTIVTIKQLA